MKNDFSKDAQNAPKAASFDLVEIATFAVARGWHWIVLLGVIGSVIGVGRALSLPNVYASRGSFMVYLGKREQRAPETAIGEETRDKNAAPGLVEELQILNNSVVYEQLAKEIGPDRILAPYDPRVYENTNNPWWKKLQHRVQAFLFRDALARSGKIDPESPTALAAATAKANAMASFKPPGQTRVLRVNCVAHDAELAQEICRTFMKLCQQRHEEYYQGQVSDTFVDKQLKAAEEEQDALNKEFYAHREQCGFFDMDDERHQLMTRKEDLRDKMLEDDIRLGDIAPELEALSAELATTEQAVEVVKAPPMEHNPERQRLEDRLDALLDRLAFVETAYVPESEAYVFWKERLEKDIAEARDRLASEPRQVEAGPPVPVIERNPEWVDLKKRVDELAMNQEQVTAARARRQKEYDKASARLDALLACEPYHREMQLRMSQATKRVNEFRKTKEDQEKLALLDHDDQSNLRVLEEATYNPEKVAPKRAKLVLKGVGGGFGAGFALALLLQLLDRRLRYPKSIERALGVRVLGVIPEHKPWRKMGRRVKKQAG